MKKEMNPAVRACACGMLALSLFATRMHWVDLPGTLWEYFHLWTDCSDSFWQYFVHSFKNVCRNGLFTGYVASPYMVSLFYGIAFMAFWLAALIGTWHGSRKSAGWFFAVSLGLSLIPIIMIPAEGYWTLYEFCREYPPASLLGAACLFCPLFALVAWLIMLLYRPDEGSKRGLDPDGFDEDGKPDAESDIYCPYCGKKLARGYLCCTGCGRRL